MRVHVLEVYTLRCDVAVIMLRCEVGDNAVSTMRVEGVSPGRGVLFVLGCVDVYIF